MGKEIRIKKSEFFRVTITQVEDMNTRDGKCKWNEKGFSLVELIIVIAIMAVVIGTVVFSVSMVFSANAKTCCNNLQRAIADCKVTTMGKSEAWLVLYRGSDNQIYCQMYYNEAMIENDAEGNPKVKKDDDGNVIMKAVPANEEPQKIGGNRVEITYIYTDEYKNEKPSSDLKKGVENGITIVFDRSSGSFKNAPKSMEIIGGNRHYHLEFNELTGKVTVKQI